MKIFTLGLLAATIAVSAASAAGGPVAGQFDSYTFALSWEPTFCEGKPGAPECQSENAGRFDATNLALHGLWPDQDGDARHDYGYCGVDAAVKALDRAPSWCRLPEPALSNTTRSDLAEAMPGAASCLDHHEWIKHGTCAGSEMSPDDYFALAAALVKKVAATRFGGYLRAHAGQTIQAEAALAAFEQDFGAGSRNKITLNCVRVNGQQALIETHLRLAKSLRSADQLGSLLLATNERGSCPSSFLLDPVR